jgi:hypothetical protein
MSPWELRVKEEEDGEELAIIGENTLIGAYP